MNKELAYEVLDYIKTHPNEWNQETWRCNTGMCFAGHAVVLSGGRFLTRTPDDIYEHAVEVVEEDHSYDIGRVSLETDLSELPIGTKYVTAADRARRVLELTAFQADDLFSANNTLEDIEQYLKDFEWEDQ